MAEERSEVTPERLMQMAWGYSAPLILEAAIENRVFDVLDQRPMTVEEVSAATGASVRGLRAIMNALVGFQFLGKDADRYTLTPESASFLVSSRPGYHGALLRHTSRHLIPAWLGLSEVVRTGKPSRPVNQQADGGEFFANFVEDLLPLNFRAAQMLADHLGATAGGPTRVLDIAAGSGVWSIPLAQRSPEVQVTVVDWPEVVPVTQRVTGRFGVADRYRYVVGDLREVDFGSGYEVALLGHILHSEGPDPARRLIRKTFDALAPGGTVVIAEMLANEDRTGPPIGVIFAVNMLVATEEGDTFTFGEISEWLREAGFTDARLLEAPAPSPLILATKPA